ncbi:hypothetical protein JL722_5419 [Aureococcus anophagefferens]|nr:hypothetical protein JL722_5419 [Aureococcus anophagefferens]
MSSMLHALAAEARTALFGPPAAHYEPPRPPDGGPPDDDGDSNAGGSSADEFFEGDDDRSETSDSDASEAARMAEEEVLFGSRFPDSPAALADDLSGAARSRPPGWRRVRRVDRALFVPQRVLACAYDDAPCGAATTTGPASSTSPPVLVGPFEAPPPEDARSRRPQSLLKIVKTTCGRLDVEEVLPVQFTPLHRGDDPGPQLALRGPVWGRDDAAVFPPAFRAAAGTLARSGAALLPAHVWDTHVLADASDDAACDYCGAADARGRCGRCKTARFCSRECQRAAWPDHKADCEPA